MLIQSLATTAAITGFGLGAGAIFSVGPQNLTLIQVGAVRSHAVVVAATGYISTLAIVVAGVCGIGVAMQSMPSLKLVLQISGIVFLLGCALRMLSPRSRRRAWRGDGSETRAHAVQSMLVATWLNPLIYAETMLLVGVLAARYDGAARVWFAVGFLAATFLRFCGLPLLGQALAPYLDSEQGHSTFNRVAGSLLLAVAASQAIAIA